MSEQSPKISDPDSSLDSGLRWLVCPVCRAELRVEDGAIGCLGCRRRYPVVDGIPILLADRAI
jgi:uncharacterized protein YbaR (Trm112 family)